MSDKFEINYESPPKRCEICHQSDLFDPLTGECRRCAAKTDLPQLPSVTNPPSRKVLYRISTIRKSIEDTAAYLLLLFVAFSMVAMIMGKGWTGVLTQIFLLLLVWRTFSQSVLEIAVNEKEELEIGTRTGRKRIPIDSITAMGRPTFWSQGTLRLFSGKQRHEFIIENRGVKIVSVAIRQGKSLTGKT